MKNQHLFPRKVLASLLIAMCVVIAIFTNYSRVLKLDGGFVDEGNYDVEKKGKDENKENKRHAPTGNSRPYQQPP